MAVLIARYVHEPQKKSQPRRSAGGASAMSAFACSAIAT